MPGLINTHTHAAMTLLRSYADDLPLMEWLENKIWPVEAHLDEQAVYWGTMLAGVEMLRSGTTCFADMYLFMEGSAKAVSELGMRAALAPGLFSFMPDPNAMLEDARDFCARWNNAAEGRITTMIAPHSAYTCDADYIRRIYGTAVELGIPVHTHLSESKQEVDDSYREHGVSPVRYLADLGLVGGHPLHVAHCVHIGQEDIQILASGDVSVAHNPQCNMKLGNGIAPVPDLLQAGVNVAVATDGVASNNNLNLWEEMRLAAFLQKGHHGDTTLMPAADALSLGTSRAAQALRIQERVGTLEAGKQADMIFLDLNQPQFQPQYDVTAGLIYSAYGSEVRRVLVGGRELVRDGHMLTVDENKVYRRAAEEARRLLSASAES
jgi:5-methylthioadenosine/S-adenosylhomocysteine deaminase